jgi:hypothetical protein
VFHDVITGYELSDNVLSERNGTVLIFVITTVRHQKIATVFLVGRESLADRSVLKNEKAIAAELVCDNGFWSVRSSYYSDRLVISSRW